jgi:integrase
VEELREFMKKAPSAADGRIFYTVGGGMIDHLILNKLCQRAAKKAGLGPLNIHLLRHTCASLLIDDGANARTLQVFMGHSDIRVTLQTYGHLFDNADQALADSMEARRQRYRETRKNGGEDGDGV